MSKEMEINRKFQRVRELAKIIALNDGRNLEISTKSEIENWRGRMEFRLGELLDKSREEEADIKIECLNEILKLLK